MTTYIIEWVCSTGTFLYSSGKNKKKMMSRFEELHKKYPLQSIRISKKTTIKERI